MHDHRIPGLKVRFSVLVASSTRTRDNDSSGGPLVSLLKEKGYEVSGYDVVNDDSEQIRKRSLELLSDSDVLVISGGTGLSSRDYTVDAIRSISSRELRGFAAVFSILSFHEIGASAIMSNSTAFIVDNKPVFCLPGSPSGSMTGLEKIIIPEIDHVIHELRK